MSERQKLPLPDLANLWEQHTAQEFVHRDVDATMRTMVAEPSVISVPVATGGRGQRDVRHFYAEHFIGRVPEDMQLKTLSRTVGTEGVVEEMLISLTHDIEVPFMLPGVAPTGRRIEIAMVAVIAFRDGKIESEHIYWDQASVLAQIGLLPSSGLPVLAGEQARALLDSAAPLNTLIST
jgi:carboxymethylenebutenolidase